MTQASTVQTFLRWWPAADQPDRSIRTRRRTSLVDVDVDVLVPSVGDPAMYAYDVFISYSHQNLDWVTEFVARLENEGLRVARDEIFMRPGDILVHAIEQAIRDSAHGILVFSQASVASGWVQQEYASLMQRSIQGGQRFIPVIIDDIELPSFAATRYYADFRQASEDTYDQRIAKIAEALRGTTGHLSRS
jgi:TIR domain